MLASAAPHLVRQARLHELVRTLLYLHQQLERAADGLDMTISQYFMLHFLHEEPRRAAEFTVVNKRRKPGITSMVGQLEARGWIERSPDPADRRAQIITITQAGLDAFRGFEASMQEALESFLGRGTVRDANRAIRPFYEAWNKRRIERFNNWRSRRGHEDAGAGDHGAAASTGKLRG